jgi:hypothetical protein
MPPDQHPAAHQRIAEGAAAAAAAAAAADTHVDLAAPGHTYPSWTILDAAASSFAAVAVAAAASDTFAAAAFAVFEAGPVAELPRQLPHHPSSLSSAAVAAGILRKHRRRPTAVLAFASCIADTRVAAAAVAAVLEASNSGTYTKTDKHKRTLATTAEKNKKPLTARDSSARKAAAAAADTAAAAAAAAEERVAAGEERAAPAVLHRAAAAACMLARP